MGEQKITYATINDVAKLAETSAATVSYVLNNNPNKSLRPETVARVMAAVEKLNYSKSAVASSLRSKKRGMVFILVPQFGNIFYTRVCESIEDILFANDIVPMFCDTRENPERERRLIESAISQRVDGIVMGPTARGWENTNVVRQLNIPLVSIGREFVSDENDGNTGNTYYVGDDSYQAGYLAGRALMKNGHTRIGFVDWEGEVTSAKDRRAGFDSAVSECVNPGIEISRKSSSMLDAETGYQLTKKLMQEFKPTAIFFGYHRLAQGGITYLQEVGYNIPEDVSVILVGTPTWASFSNVPFAVIDQNEEWIGMTAGKIVSALLEEKPSQPILTEHRHICQCVLHEQKSIKNLNG